MNLVADTLRSAAVVLLIPGAHAKGAMARNKWSRKVPSAAPAACRWCMFGALKEAAPTDTFANRALQALGAHLGFNPIVFNDNPAATPIDVAAAMWAAADKLESEA